jgi:uncharacterized protein YjiS (DUF1127 family)
MPAILRWPERLTFGFLPVRRMRDALAARRAAHDLAQLDDRLLRDIGLDRSDLHRALAGEQEDESLIR